ncbi:SIS domain-containing protein [Neobacillus niacini]|uniref:SIS domain-containing protein n=1 Tax=Neobacillus niacini TaxID=86668 RepID=UPI003983396B
MVNAQVKVNEDVRTILEVLKDKTIEHVYFIACGGSLAVMHPNKYYLDQNSEKLSTDFYNSHEFVYRNPVGINESSLVVLCSQTGNTKETVEAAEFAKTKGALTVGLTEDIESPLAKAVDYTIKYKAFYTTGIPIDIVDSNYSVLYQFVSGLVKIYDGKDQMAKMINSLSNLQAVIDRTHEQYEEYTNTFAKAFKDEKVIYTMASGANYGAAYSYAICVLMEMQWIHSQAIHAGEFFHGPFEVLDKDVPFIMLKGLDHTRHLEERAHNFLSKFGGNTLVLDAKDFDFTGVDEDVQGYLAPIVFFEVLWKFAYKLAEERNKPMLVSRRYMKKFDY